MNKIQIIRTQQDSKQTIGAQSRIVDDNGGTVFGFVSMERAWVNNQRMISCIPVGIVTGKQIGRAHV